MPLARSSRVANWVDQPGAFCKFAKMQMSALEVGGVRCLQVMPELGTAHAAAAAVAVAAAAA
eukprot:CAMPEP_0172700242 /NCGR_PEP_ID=MMETSP1074-20121228/30767_1 /TAXON_ID=2916 /ORGANISM="Ceratium fusus, Strain PA161109" /LENGTH=61 /DNA_ID=CAMNT_0013521587 /DNA_START=412 /DNA_END=595 /DNA_ORIENTATION=+